MSVDVNFRANSGASSSSSSGSASSGVWAFPNNPTAKISDYTIALTDGLIKVNATSGVKTITLPSAAACYVDGKGQVFAIKKIDLSDNVVMLKVNSSPEMIDGFSSISITLQYDSITVQSNGGGWDVLSTN